MPGLNQLKDFSSDVKVLGDEIKKRTMRGEPIFQVPLPENIPEADDSEDFVFGLPSKESLEITQKKSDIDEDLKSLMGESAPDSSSLPTDDLSGLDPEIAKLLGGSFDAPPPADTSANTVANAESDAPFDLPESVAPFDLPDSDAQFDLPKTDAPFDLPETDAQFDLPESDAQFDLPESDAQFDLPESDAQFDLPESDAQFDLPESDAPFDLPKSDAPFDLPESDALFDLPKSDAPFDLPESDATFDLPESDAQFDLPETDAQFDLPKSDAQFDLPKSDAPFDLPESDAQFDLPESDAPFDLPKTDAPLSYDSSTGIDNDVFNIDNIDELEPLEELEEVDESSASSIDDDFGVPIDTFVPSPKKSTDEYTPPKKDSTPVNFDASPIDLGSENFEMPPIEEYEAPASASSTDDTFSLPEFDNYVPPENSATDTSFEMPPIEEYESPASTSSTDDTFSLPEFDDVTLPESDSTTPADTSLDDAFQDMSLPDDMEGFGSDSVPIMSDDELDSLDSFKTTDGLLGGDSSSGDDEFSMPQFEGFGSSSSSGFSTNGSDEKIPNSLTDKEYNTFKKNLLEYPLNLRIAIEEVIVKNEFNDDVVFNVIEKVLKKVSARQLANYLSKYLDISVQVPRDFERRTASEYENYKQSIQYQIKNVIVPALVAGVFIISFIVVFSILGNKYVYKPMAAEKAYKEGYELLEDNMYQQAEMKFNFGVSLKPKKEWFFKYARGFVKHHQYDRARVKYDSILKRFNHDLEAGLEYANMELNELANYSGAANIVTREILDYHINDKRAMLLLGDIYLEWATDLDESKFQDAIDQYTDLINLYGNTNEYSTRLMRYYIRTDQLKNVLPLKEYFFKSKKSLGAQDLVELSGYLVDKLYGDMKPTEEYLRTEILDVRSLLEMAVKADSSIPEASYNMGRYFVYKANTSSAIYMLEQAADNFEKLTKRKKAGVYKHIDTYRLLGELQTEKKEFLLAEDYLGKGIRLFESENKNSGLEPTPDVGKMYSDLGDINYFISGDLQVALENYKSAMKNKYDVPSVEYRTGYIYYTGGDYDSALHAFRKTVDENGKDTNALFALANTFFLKDDYTIAHGYYSRLMQILDNKRAQHQILFPQVHSEQHDLVDMYMKASNNLGVTLSRLALRTGDSTKNSKALVHLSESNRAYDALTRNQTTMVRLDGSNLAAMNMNYLTAPRKGFSPEIYTEVPRILNGEKVLKQDFVK